VSGVVFFMVRLSLLALLILTPVLAVLADVLVTNTGGRWEGVVTDKGDSYQIVQPNGSKMTFPKSTVREVQVGAEPKKEALPGTTPALNLTDKDKPAGAALPVESFESAVREIEQTKATIIQDKNLTTAQLAEAIAKAEDRLRKRFESHLWRTEAQVNDVIPGDGVNKWELDLTVAGKQVRCPANIDRDKALSLHRGDKLTVCLRISFQDFDSWQVTGVILGASLPAETLETLCNFFGIPIRAARGGKIVYVVDRSGSMSDSLEFVKYELKRSIGELSEIREFHVIFYSSGPPIEMPSRRLVNATARNKQMAFEFIDGVIAQGETDPSKALDLAFGCKPELIYLLTDGEFDRAIIDQVKRLNVGGQVAVHTIGFLYKTGEAVMRQIADDNHGKYNFVSQSDLPNLVNGSVAKDVSPSQKHSGGGSPQALMQTPATKGISPPTPVESALVEWRKKLREANNDKYTDVERQQLRAEAGAFIRSSLGTGTFTLTMNVENVGEVRGHRSDPCGACKGTGFVEVKTVSTPASAYPTAPTISFTKVICKACNGSRHTESAITNTWWIDVGPINNVGLSLYAPRRTGVSGSREDAAFWVSMTQDESLKIKKGDLLTLIATLAPETAGTPGSSTSPRLDKGRSRSTTSNPTLRQNADTWTITRTSEGLHLEIKNIKVTVGPLVSAPVE